MQLQIAAMQTVSLLPSGDFAFCQTTLVVVTLIYGIRLSYVIVSETFPSISKF